MDSLLQQLTDWLKEMLVSGIMDNLTNTFASVNREVGEIANTVGQTPSGFLPGVYSLIRNLSENVIMPVAGIILTFIACYELIQLVISHNNLANFETWIFWKWVFKTFVAVTLITNTFNITMAVFDVAQWVGRLLNTPIWEHLEKATQSLCDFFHQVIECFNLLRCFMIV